MTNELISIIVPVYGEEDYIGQGIESLCAQTYKNIEIILVDDGSPDGSGDICDRYAAKDKRIKVIHKPNGGLVSARKAGMRAASGSVIGYMDGDDWVEPQMYETLYSTMLKSGADIVAPGYTEDLLEQRNRCLNGFPAGVYTGDELWKKLVPGMLCMEEFSHFGICTFLWNKLFRREVVRESQLAVDDRIFIGEDASCLYPSILRSKSVVVTEDTFYHYRQRTDSMIKTKSVHGAKELPALKIMYDHMRTVFMQSAYSDVLLPQLDRYLLSLASVRSECVLSEDVSLNTLFPFHDRPGVTSLAVVGAGTFGQHLMTRLKASSKYSVECWADEEHSTYQRIGLPVSPLSELLSTQYDILLVAFIDRCVSGEYQRILENMGIEHGKIAVIDYNDNDVGSALCRFGFNGGKI